MRWIEDSQRYHSFQDAADDAKLLAHQLGVNVSIDKDGLFWVITYDAAALERLRRKEEQDMINSMYPSEEERRREEFDKSCQADPAWQEDGDDTPSMPEPDEDDDDISSISAPNEDVDEDSDGA